MNKFWNFVRDETDERVLRLDGAISEYTWFDDEVTPKIFRDELNVGEGDITIWINSPGGDVFAASEIYNMLKEYRGRVTVKIDALAASAASIVAMAGDTIEIAPAGQIFLHDPETFAAGNVGEFNSAIQMLQEVKEGIINIYEQKTHLPRAQISELMTSATWLNAKKSVELGFADKIIGEENPQQIAQPAASFSQRTVTNSLATAFKAKRTAKEKPAVKCASRRRRLKVIEQFCETTLIRGAKKCFDLAEN